MATITQETFDGAFEAAKNYIDRQDAKHAARLAALEEKIVALSARVTAAEAQLTIAAKGGKAVKQIITSRDENGCLRATVMEPAEGSDGATRYRGVWREQQVYRLGDLVTARGSMWHANLPETTARPGDGSSAWTLAVKAGRDGKDATA